MVRPWDTSDSGHGVQLVHYEIFDASKVPEDKQAELNQLVEGSVKTDFPRRRPGEIAHFVTQAEQGRADLNALVGTPLLQAGQAFRRHLGMLATDISTDPTTMIAWLTIADNTSSSRSGMLGFIEQQAKLRAPEALGPLADHRFTWLGHAAMRDEIRAAIEGSTDVVNPLDVMLKVLLRSRGAGQPVTAYPWGRDPEHHEDGFILLEPGEQTLKKWLGSVGFKSQPDSGKLVYGFGPLSSSQIWQERYVAPSGDAVGKAIMRKEGAEQQVQFALGQLSQRSLRLLGA